MRASKKQTEIIVEYINVSDYSGILNIHRYIQTKHLCKCTKM